jgi:hypothetical protein
VQLFPSFAPSAAISIHQVQTKRLTYRYPSLNWNIGEKAHQTLRARAVLETKVRQVLASPLQELMSGVGSKLQDFPPITLGGHTYGYGTPEFFKELKRFILLTPEEKETLIQQETRALYWKLKIKTLWNQLLNTCLTFLKRMFRYR